MTPTKVKQILAAHPALDLDAVHGAAEEMQRHGAGPGAIAESLLASPPKAKAAGGWRNYSDAGDLYRSGDDLDGIDPKYLPGWEEER